MIDMTPNQNGEVLATDRFGNLITSVTVGQLAGAL
jgi:S-adenosylmethionine hydrolase